MTEKLASGDQRILLFSIFILSLCGITYELVLGSLATYLLGNPVQQYSITIGFFLSSMGLGSFLSRYLVKDIIRTFVRIEIALGFFGGISVILLSFFFTFSSTYYALHIFFLVLVGVLVGLEIPLLTRILRSYGALKDILSNVLSLDYLGGLAGSLFFPLVLFPFVGRTLTSLLVGMANIAVAALITARVEYPGKRKADLLVPVMAIVLLAVLAFQSDYITNIFQRRLYQDNIIFSKRSRYQEIVLTRNESDFRLYLDGSLQFSSIDEHRYHEMLVHPALLLNPTPEKRVLVLGGGDGLAVREILRHVDVKKVVLVELDPAIIALARNNPSMRFVNRGSLLDRRVRVVVDDAYRYLQEARERFDVIIADFPDPHDETLSKLYTVEFYRLVRRSMAPSCVFITQSTSPLAAAEAFWCINRTLKQVFPAVIPYHVYIPTFGDWGFNLCLMEEGEKKRVPGGIRGVRYYSSEAFQNALFFPGDTKAKGTLVNNFNKPVLYTYYLKGWKYNVEL